MKMKEGHLAVNEFTRKKLETVLNFCRKPEKMFEIGFQAGHSTRMFLELFPEMEVHSIDICEYDFTEELGRKLEEEFPNFTFTNKNSHDLTTEDLDGYEFVFVDGGHDEETVENDIGIAIKSNIPFILVDDYSLQFPQVKAISNLMVKENDYHWFSDPIHYFSEFNSSISDSSFRLMVRDDLISTYPEHIHHLFVK